MTKAEKRDVRRRALLRQDTEDRLRVRLRKLMLTMERKTNPNAVVDEARQLPTLPGVCALSIATRYIEGGRMRFVEFVQLAMLNGDDHARAWIEVFADLTPVERETVSFDDVCAASGVRPADLVAAVTSTAVQVGLDTGNLVAALTHPQVVAASVKHAKDAGGLEDRRMLFQHAGFIPVPKNTAPTVVVNNSATAQAASAARSDAAPGMETDAAGLPSFAQTLKQVGSALQPAPRPAELPPAEPVEAIAFDEVPDGELVPVLVAGVDDGEGDASYDYDTE